MKTAIKLIEMRLDWLNKMWPMSASKRERISELQVLLLLANQIEEGRTVEDILSTLSHD